MNIYKKLTVHNGWVNGFTHHPGFHGGPLPTSAVMGLISHTMVGNLPHTDALFTPGRTERSGNSAHFGTAQDGTVIQWVPLGVVAFHAIDANDHWYAVENADDGEPEQPVHRRAALAHRTDPRADLKAGVRPVHTPGDQARRTKRAWERTTWVAPPGAATVAPTRHERPNHTRSRARAEIVRRAMIIRQHDQYPVPQPDSP